MIIADMARASGFGFDLWQSRRFNETTKEGKLMIKIYYSSVDGCRSVKNFKSLAGAKKYSHRMIGKHPEIGSNYAVSGDGIGKVQVAGASLAEMFPQEG